MQRQPWYIALLIGIMAAIRFVLSGIGYMQPGWLMQQLGAPTATNVQGPYMVRVWAIRDIVLSILVVCAHGESLKRLLVSCIVIDATDVVSAHVSGRAGLFNTKDTRSLKTTALLALLPELAALVLISRRDRAS